MATTVTPVKLEGFEDLKNAFRWIAKETRDKVAPSMTNSAATVVQKDAIARAPVSKEPHFVQMDKGRDKVEVQPGNLKRNIAKRRNRKTELTAETLVYVRGSKKAGYASRYGRLKEYGTVKMPATPFMRPAIENNIPQAIEAMKKRGTRMIGAFAGYMPKRRSKAAG